MEALPTGAIGGVVVGPSQSPFGEKDRTTIFTFNREGKPLGKIVGGAIGDAQILGAPGRLVAATNDDVVASTEVGNASTPSPGVLVQAASQNVESSRSAMWFNTGYSDEEYRNSYVSIDVSSSSDSGTVPGLVLASTFCGDSLFAIVENVDTVKFGQPYESWLYEIPPGEEPIVRGTMTFDDAFMPASREATCSSDGSTINAFYASSETRSNEKGGIPGLSLVQIDTRDGSHTTSSIMMDGYTWRVAWGTVSILDERMYWATTDGDILSIPMNGAIKAEKLWSLPAGGLSTRMAVQGNRVTQLDFRDATTYTEYDARTGDVTMGPIELPWLDPFVDAVTESGTASYTLLDIASLH
ncbi:hypothetical protein P9990_25040 (plasmid) [Prescottella equi]|uniref:hypothetical protein n=1 Tax=Rhodococcus hoagii TaxID=43767 RepID=UPI002578E67B|nr:hypothetical protein [Prescottella equi]WJJ14463.1 hypothetical protein P9990_25040 [Prescottella equi]